MNRRFSAPVRPVTLAAALLAAGCGSGGIDFASPPTSSAGATGREIIERSVETQGGNLFTDLTDVAVAYEGEWGFVATRVQPIVTDRRYRKASEERYLFPEGIVYQRHKGPGGVKTVVRTRDDVTVAYDGVEDSSDDTREASALVADVYLMLTTGPSFFLRDGVELTAAGTATAKGRSYDLVRARLTPGFGFSAADEAEIWIDRENGCLHRIQFTLEGFRTTRGAQVDVIFSEPREIDGRLWPTQYVERIRAPFDVFAHRWRLVGLDVDRGLTLDDLSGPEVSDRAARPADALPSASP